MTQKMQRKLRAASIDKRNLRGNFFRARERSLLRQQYRPNNAPQKQHISFLGCLTTKNISTRYVRISNLTTQSTPTESVRSSHPSRPRPHTVPSCTHNSVSHGPQMTKQLSHFPPPRRSFAGANPSTLKSSTHFSTRVTYSRQAIVSADSY